MHQLRRTARILLLSFVALAMAGTVAVAQKRTMSILSVDTSGFPDMSAEFIVLDAAGNPVDDLDAANFTATDNGEPVGPLTIECPPPDPPTPIHCVLAIDRSGSMSLVTPSGKSRFAVLKAGASAFVRAVQFVGETEVAVTAFDNLPFLIAAFSQSEGLLTTLINAIKLGEGTEYMPAFVQPVIGALTMLEGRPEGGARRAVVFITDGLPNNPPDVDSIVRRANAANIAIYTITIGLPMTPDLRAIAERTGGQHYGNVQDEERMRAVYTAIALQTQGRRPCRVRWRAPLACGVNSIYRTFTLSEKNGPTASAPYTAPLRSVIRAEVTPEYLWFGPVVPGDSADRSFTLTAHGSAMTIDGLDLGASGRFRTVDWGGTPPPFVLADGESRTMTIRFLPADSMVVSTNMQPITRPCPTHSITISGGIRGPRFTDVLRLASPVGGESYSGCEAIAIRWEGVPPEEPVTIEYSANGGATWNPIARNVTGLRYTWNAPAPGTNYRIRVTSSRAEQPDSISTVAGGGAFDADNLPATSVQLVAPTGLAADGDALYIAESGRHRVRRVDLLSGTISTIAGTGAAGNGGDGGPASSARLANPTGLAIAGQYLYIADYSNHRVRRIDLATGIITTVAGTGGSGFSGDGGAAVNAELQFPAHVAVSDDGLFIADAGNGRVRFVEFKTNTISTIAGGGWVVGGDGQRAVEVILNRPIGLAIGRDPRRLSDSLLIAEEGSHRVRIVELKSNIISTMAGTGFSGYDGDGRDGRDLKLNKPRGIAIDNDRLFIADAANARIRLLSRSTNIIRTIAGTGTAGYAGDGGPAIFARVNEPQGLAADAGRLFVADVLNDRVRLIWLSTTGRVDSSRSSFEVSVGRITVAVDGRRVAFGAGAVGLSRDTAIDAALCNRTAVPIVIDSVAIVGANASDFSIVSGTGAELTPGACVPIELRFTPGAIGPRSARAIVFGRCGGGDTLSLEGIGAEPCSFRAIRDLDMGSADIDTQRDSIVTQSICNTGTVTLDGLVSIAPADGMFSIVSGGGPFAIGPNQCHTVTVRFSPTRGGPASGVIDYGLGPVCGTAQTLVVGNGRSAQRAVIPPLTFAGRPCDAWPRDTTISITNTGDAPLRVTGLQVIANNEGFSITSPLPTPAAPLVIAPKSAAAVGLRLDPATPGAKTATLRATSNDPASPTDVALDGRRDIVALALPAGITFDGTLPAPSYPVEQTVVVRNTGTVAVDVADAVFGGADPGRFELVSGQLPATIPPGDSLALRVRLLVPSGDTARAATMRLSHAPSCDSASSMRLFATGLLPSVSVDALSFDALRCPDDIESDSAITIRNTGGAPLRITMLTLGGANPAAFAVLDGTPIVVPPFGSVDVRLAFRPPAPGAYTATLRVSSDAAGGDSVAELAGTRLTVGLAPLPAMSFAHSAPTAVSIGALVLGNIGTSNLRLSLSTGTAFFVPRALSVVVRPADSSLVEIEFRGTTPGDYSDTLIVSDQDCGVLARVPLRGRVAPSVRSVVRLPVDSARPGSRITIPISIGLSDIVLFAQSGAADWRATIAFDGRLLMPQSATRADIVAQSFDAQSGTQSITLAGRYAGGDTLALLRCDVPSSARGATPLRFVTFAWDSSAVGADTINGAFTATNECGPGGMLSARIQGLKVRPMPARDEAVVEFELGEEHSIVLAIEDALGRRRELAAGRYAAGRHELNVALDLATGYYRLSLVTPFGSASLPVIIAR